MKYVVVFIVCVTLSGCSGEHVDPVPTGAPIVVAVLPDQSSDALLSRHTPLLDYLEDYTSLDLELLIPRDYSDLLDQFDAGHVHLAWFGGLTFTQAEARSQAVPLAFRDIDLQFTSCYLATGDDPRSSVREFEGAKFSYGPQLSTSGHLMPRYFLESDGRYPEQFFASTRYSAGHDQTARWVSDGRVALGVANCTIVRSLFENGALNEDNVRIIETTPPYSNYVWAVSPSMDERTRAMLLDALLALDASDAEQRAVLRSQGANAYLPAATGNFLLVRMAARRSGLLTDDEKN
ncbi:MAG: phosphate/phosphite/phosphonate ABC transporter substrate-binding protein [Woeseiaceae bacterium]